MKEVSKGGYTIIGVLIGGLTHCCDVYKRLWFVLGLYIDVDNPGVDVFKIKGAEYRNNKSKNNCRSDSIQERRMCSANSVGVVLCQEKGN